MAAKKKKRYVRARRRRIAWTPEVSAYYEWRELFGIALMGSDARIAESIADDAMLIIKERRKKAGMEP